MIYKCLAWPVTCKVWMLNFFAVVLDKIYNGGFQCARQIFSMLVPPGVPMGSPQVMA